MARFLYQTREFDCPVQLSMNVLMGKWKVLVLWQLFLKNRRYGELKRLVPGISHKVLSDTLKVLEEERFIFRHDFQENPPHVEYGLTDQDVTSSRFYVPYNNGGCSIKHPTHLNVRTCPSERV